VLTVNIKVSAIHKNGKVKFTIEQPMKAQRGSRGISLLFSFNLGARSGWVISATLWLLYSWKRDPVPIVKEAGWIPGQVWMGAENFFSPDFCPTCSHSLYKLCYSSPHLQSVGLGVFRGIELECPYKKALSFMDITNKLHFFLKELELEMAKVEEKNAKDTEILKEKLKEKEEECEAEKAKLIEEKKENEISESKTKEMLRDLM
jgi:hypothetical protein